jgi:hypothetical protein
MYMYCKRATLHLIKTERQKKWNKKGKFNKSKEEGTVEG